MVALMALALVVTFAVWWLATSTPTWWSGAGTLPDNAAERAEALERGGTRALSDARDESKPWTVSIAEADANAWLAHRLRQWAENRGFEANITSADGSPLPPPRVEFEHGRIRLGIETGGRIVGLSAVPALDHGALFIRDTSLFLGRINLPSAWTRKSADEIVERLLPDADDEVRSLVRAFMRGDEPIANPARFDLGDEREVILERILIEDDRLLLTCRTVLAGPRS